MPRQRAYSPRWHIRRVCALSASSRVLMPSVARISSRGLDLAQSTVSQHLKILVDAGLVRYQPVGPEFALQHQPGQHLPMLLHLSSDMAKPMLPAMTQSSGEPRHRPDRSHSQGLTVANKTVSAEFWKDAPDHPQSLALHVAAWNARTCECGWSGLPFIWSSPRSS